MWEMIFIALAALESEEERKKISDFYWESNYYFLHYALGITHNQHMAEEAIQETFLYVIKNKEKYLHLSCRDFRSYAVYILRKRCINHLNSTKKRMNDIPFEEAEDFLDVGVESTEEQYETMAEFESVMGMVDSLGEIYKTVFLMRFKYGLSYQEISDELGITKKNVEVRISRSLAKVRDMLEEKESKNDE